MGTAERRTAILKILYKRRFETISNLATEFGVSDRTIRRDIEILSLTEPIYTKCGRHGGGIYIMEGYSMNQVFVSKEESMLLNKIYLLDKEHLKNLLSPKEYYMLSSLHAKYTIPSNGTETHE